MLILMTVKSATAPTRPSGPFHGGVAVAPDWNNGARAAPAEGSSEQGGG